MSIATKITALREAEGWSKAELGRRMDLPGSVISRLEDPTYDKYNIRTLRAVAAAFGAELEVNFVGARASIHLEAMEREYGPLMNGEST